MPTPDTHSVSILHKPSASRFETTVDGQLCIADYTLSGQRMSMTHTYVPHALEGRGIAAALVAQALAHARREGWRVRPLCSYVARYMQRHPETLDLLDT
jgi:predicted GNAT family acetyltransferase